MGEAQAAKRFAGWGDALICASRHERDGGTGKALLTMRRVHGTCVAIGGGGVLLRGRPAAGKSDLALRLIDAGGRLVADDQVDLRRTARGILASAPKAIAGLLEVRGVGILDVPSVARARIVLAVDLLARGRVERLPALRHLRLLGVSVPRLALSPFESSAAAKVRLAARAARLGRLWRPTGKADRLGRPSKKADRLGRPSKKAGHPWPARKTDRA